MSTDDDILLLFDENELLLFEKTKEFAKGYYECFYFVLFCELYSNLITSDYGTSH